jgi:O-methyltransferase
LFENTLYQKLSEQKFSLVLLDCDVYDATKFALEFIYPRMTTNGIIVLDDYERAYTEKPLWGATKAIDEFAKKNNLKINTYPDNHIIKL